MSGWKPFVGRRRLGKSTPLIFELVAVRQKSSTLKSPPTLWPLLLFPAIVYFMIAKFDKFKRNSSFFFFKVLFLIDEDQFLETEEIQEGLKDKKCFLTRLIAG